MNNRKEDVRRIWQECFNDTPQWIDMFFSKVYADENALVLDYKDRPVSSLMLQRYFMAFHGEEIAMGYIAGAATKRSERGHGYMSQLIKIALRHASHRGDCIVSLIPASRRLFFFYDRLGFSTVFYVRENRYTSLHSFSPHDSYSLVDDMSSEAVFDFFRMCELRRNGSVLHSYDDFCNILSDNRLDNGTVIAVARQDSIEPAAMGFAVVNEHENHLIVKDILSVDEDAAEGLMAKFRDIYPDMPVTVVTPVTPGIQPIEARGMTRIVNVAELLGVLARSYPDLKISIKVSDDIIPDNNRIFVIRDGNVSALTAFSGKIDLDVPVDILGSIIFSTPKVGDVFGLPSVRPFMSLMLE